MDEASERYTGEVAAALAAVLGPPGGPSPPAGPARLVGVYLHGSAVLGGFDARRSDIDLLAVVDGPVTPAQQAAVAARLDADRLPCPAKGLELSVVTRAAAAAPTATPLFELHLTTAPGDRKVVEVEGGRWALERVVAAADRALVSAALDRQRCPPVAQPHPPAAGPAAVRAFVDGVRERVEDEVRRLRRRRR